jgi:hypothetical protein
VFWDLAPLNQPLLVHLWPDLVGVKMGRQAAGASTNFRANAYEKDWTWPFTYVLNTNVGQARWYSPLMKPPIFPVLRTETSNCKFKAFKHMMISSPRENPPNISYLRETFFNKKERRRELLQSTITDMVAYATFAEFACDFFKRAAYPKLGSNKYETYSFLPTLFNESPSRSMSRLGEMGLWRCGDFSVHSVSLWYADLDNHHDDKPMVEFEAVQAMLDHYRLSYVLYTSYSHTPGKHKVRIIVPVDREMSYDEAFKVFAWFNDLLYTQLDGSIYDDGDHLYGPTFGGKRAVNVSGQSLCVDAVLALYEALDDEAKAAVSRNKASAHPALKPMTPEEIAHYKARVADERESADDVNIVNPRYFNPGWMSDLHGRYCGGSRHQTLFGLLARCWAKSGGSLSITDMRSLMQDIDAEWGFHCHHAYGDALESDLRKVMRNVVEARSSTESEKNRARLEQGIKRLSKWMP